MVWNNILSPISIWDILSPYQKKFSLQLTTRKLLLKCSAYRHLRQGRQADYGILTLKHNSKQCDSTVKYILCVEAERAFKKHLTNVFNSVQEQVNEFTS